MPRNRSRYEEYKKLRDEGLTFREIAKRCGVSSSTVSNSIYYQRNPEHRERANRLARLSYKNRYGIDDEYTEKRRNSTRYNDLNRKIPLKYKQAFDLKAKGLSTKEISEKLGIKTSTVYSYLTIAKKREKFTEKPSPTKVPNSKIKFPSKALQAFDLRNAGLTNKEISEKLGTTVGTVKTYIYWINNPEAYSKFKKERAIRNRDEYRNNPEERKRKNKRCRDNRNKKYGIDEKFTEAMRAAQRKYYAKKKGE